jgi:hypothetical protein
MYWVPRSSTHAQWLCLRVSPVRRGATRRQPARPDILESLAVLAPLDFRGRQAYKEQLLRSPDRLDRPGSPDRQAIRASRATPAYPASLLIRELPALQVQQEWRAMQPTQGLPARPGLRARRDFQERRRTQVRLDLQGLLARLDQQVQQLILERRDPRVQLERLAQLVSQALVAQRQTLDLLDQPV